MYSLAIDRLGNELQALGVSGHDLRCLLLLPQVHVGWASPQRPVPALERLLDTTSRHAQFPRECLELARGWLFERPSPAQFRSGFALLRLLGRARDAPLLDSSDVLQGMLWAIRAAHIIQQSAMTSTQRTLGHAELQHALSDLETWLELDTRPLWIDLFSEAIAVAPRRQSSVTTGLVTTPDPSHEDERSVLLLRPKPAGPASAPFPLTRRLA